MAVKTYKCLKTLTTPQGRVRFKGNKFYSTSENGGCIIGEDKELDRVGSQDPLMKHFRDYPFGENEGIDRGLFPETDFGDAINPKHYKSYSVETIDMMIAIYGEEWVAIHCELTAFKYRMRAGKKDDLQQDLEKEKWYLNKAKELRK